MTKCPPAPASTVDHQVGPLPVRWLLPLLLRLTSSGPARRRTAAVELLGEVTRQLREASARAERQGQQQLAGVLGAPVYPPEPRWRARRRAA